MKVQIMISNFPLVITLLCLGSLLTTLTWLVYESNRMDPNVPAPQRKRPPRNYDITQDSKEFIDRIMQRYSKIWKMQEDNNFKFRSQLSSSCNGFDKAIITQTNTPVGRIIKYDGEKKRNITVTEKIFSTFLKGHPFSGKRLDTCAVVGNGGILSYSHCGEIIDSAQFVIRCNIPPLENGHEKDVGVKTDLVTVNPSILFKKYHALMERRRQFVDNLRIYGKSLMLLPAFSYGGNTPVSLRVAYSIEDFESPLQPAFFNPDYLQSLNTFWRDQGLKAARLSTGLMMVSLALEICENVHLYGFWPFSNHPYDLYALTNHYYDDMQPKKNIHAMPVEFDQLLKLHNEGVLKLHLGDCHPGTT